jgi:DNA gyrase/topoisomerase IV subunit A
MKKIKKGSGPKLDKGRIKSQSITVFGMKALKLYGDEVNLDRATPDLIDGLKPVVRRIVWGTSQVAKTVFAKSAQIVGQVMGTYHPHGDSSIYGAMVTSVQSCTPLLHGKGGWGNLIDSAAAMRYTNARLSHFGRTGLDPDYANKEVTAFVPNYDDKTIEPVSIPYPLPIILFNGGEGIGYAGACNLPSFTPESVVEVLKQLLGGEKLKAEDFAKTLKPVQRWGGEFVKSRENKKAWLEMFTSNKASVQFQSPLIVDSVKKTVIVNEWPSGLDPEKFVEWARALPETNECYPSKGSAEFTIVMRKGYNSVQFDKWVEQIQKKTRVKSSFNINVTSRKAIIVDGVVDYEVALLSLSVPKLLVAWLRARLEIEIKSLQYRIARQQEAIDYSKLLIFAANKLDIIVPIIRTSKNPRDDLAKKLKITLVQADQILDLTLRKLTRLDQDVWKDKLKDQLKFMEQLNKWLKAPKKKMMVDMEAAMEAIKLDRLHIESQDKQKLTLKK